MAHVSVCATIMEGEHNGGLKWCEGALLNLLMPHMLEIVGFTLTSSPTQHWHGSIMTQSKTSRMTLCISRCQLE